MGMLCGAVTLIAFGSTSQPSAFVRYQLKEKVRRSREVSTELQNKEREETEHQNRQEGEEDKEISSELQNRDENGNISDSNEEIIEENQNPDDSRERRDTDTNSADQNKEDSKERREISSEQEDVEQNQGKLPVNLSSNLWIMSASMFGAFLGSFFPTGNETQWKDPFKVAPLFLGVAHLLFYSGCFCYSFEEPRGSPLQKIYRVFVAALRKRKLKYPDSEGEYNCENNERNFSFPRKTGDGSIRLKPQVPRLWRWLDKAAIKSGEGEKQSKNGEICSVDEVREVKHFSSLMHMSFTFWPFSLVLASANTFFVEQAGTLKPNFNVNYLFVISSVVSSTTDKLFNLKKLDKHKHGVSIVRIGVGMVCAVVCCLVAGLLELHRLSLARKEGIVQSRGKQVSMGIAVLIPQFLLMGLMEGLAQKGLEEFYSNYVPESMEGFVQPFAELVSGTGKLLTLPCIWIFTPWFKDSINNSHLDRYFLMLAGLNFLALCWFVYYSWNYAYHEPYPNDEELGNDDEGGQEEKCQGY
ncbi:hypothetical protein L6164_002228 [Bauhinia variegata]|uniref:Uncharacterized protein n=1 Tax=Bauhinia variegata TaxID=167791 RepID=A0ACB9PY28_BAUVA|nr:hypothetical protein L6164_002228 [Bauhinia variegata]